MALTVPVAYRVNTMAFQTASHSQQQWVNYTVVPAATQPTYTTYVPAQHAQENMMVPLHYASFVKPAPTSYMVPRPFTDSTTAYANTTFQRQSVSDLSPFDVKKPKTLHQEPQIDNSQPTCTVPFIRGINAVPAVSDICQKQSTCKDQLDVSAFAAVVVEISKTKESTDIVVDGHVSKRFKNERKKKARGRSGRGRGNRGQRNTEKKEVKVDLSAVCGHPLPQEPLQVASTREVLTKARILREVKDIGIVTAAYADVGTVVEIAQPNSVYSDESKMYVLTSGPGPKVVLGWIEPAAFVEGARSTVSINFENMRRVEVLSDAKLAEHRGAGAPTLTSNTKGMKGVLIEKDENGMCHVGVIKDRILYSKGWVMENELCVYSAKDERRATFLQLLTTGLTASTESSEQKSTRTPANERRPEEEEEEVASLLNSELWDFKTVATGCDTDSEWSEDQEEITPEEWDSLPLGGLTIFSAC